MSRHEWAREALQDILDEARLNGYEEGLMLRALLGVVVERSKDSRSQADLAQELIFLADNLDDDRDYAFMRP